MCSVIASSSSLRLQRCRLSQKLRASCMLSVKRPDLAASAQVHKPLGGRGRSKPEWLKKRLSSAERGMNQEAGISENRIMRRRSQCRRGWR